ncbi:MAG: hypothetical protein R3F13_14395 [Prosthecobacter sp.]
MNLLRSVLCLLLAACLTSCSTLGGLMNSYPVRMLDQTGSALMGYFVENDAANGPSSIEERARQIESKGVYAGAGSAHGADASATVVSR